MGVSPISLKKNRCSRHFRPMERSAGSRRRSFANLGDGWKDEKDSNVSNDYIAINRKLKTRIQKMQEEREICENILYILFKLLSKGILENAEIELTRAELIAAGCGVKWDGSQNASLNITISNSVKLNLCSVCQHSQKVSTDKPYVTPYALQLL